MYESGGGGCGDGDLLRILKDEEESPSYGAIFNMCRQLGIEEDERRTITNDDGWAYFYELFAQVASSMSRDEICELLDSYLFSEEVDAHLAHIEQGKRRTA